MTRTPILFSASASVGAAAVRRLATQMVGMLDRASDKLDEALARLANVGARTAPRIVVLADNSLAPANAARADGVQVSANVLFRVRALLHPPQCRAPRARPKA
ncbi:hypothetical protein [Variovorax sp. dw_954]|uniref:hypothetical protein n=1 Tax=Variovorax sp. dw_954 TaxID=2720078 RepID=UPI001BD54A0D|nr:hypothetical protein [Variovorax sp. dw_954]